MIKTVNPYTREILKEYAYLTEGEITDALEFSAAVFPRWKQSNFLSREKACRELGRELRERINALAELITNEMGKPIAEARVEIEKCIALCEYYANATEKNLHSKEVKSDYNVSYLTYEPLGAVFGVMPWNFPFWQVFRFAIPNIMAGNIVLLKPAPNTAGCGMEIQELFEDAGFPMGVFQTLLIEVNAVEQVIAHPVVQGVTLTGSEKAGSSVAALAGKHIKKSVLELGGNDAFILLPDCRWKRAVAAGVQSRIGNTGQTCIAAKRFFVHEKDLEKFVELYKTELEKIESGDVLNAKTELGVIARADLSDKLETQIKKCVEAGGKEWIASKRKGNAFTPGLMQVRANNPILKEEIFGPVGIVQTYQDETDLIDKVNDSDFGLGAAIWSANLQHANTLASHLHVGTVAINSIVKSDPRLPFGGVKRSGYGRELSTHGLLEFVNIKTVYGQID